MDIDRIIESKIMRLNTTERKLMWLMIRNKSNDGLRWCEIPIDEFCSATGKSSSSCSRTIQYLAEHELIALRKVRLGSSYRNQFKLIPLEQDK
ncbi:hypothetical protein AWM79_07660 [Pseudomonas agarici]|uniref:Helix-turn-helix domain-containing protein n=1 Tax=Pseudomonas agarici TaxID=46677 RepID=A0A0X1SZF0_PSEAA|nr:hypothetical protein AWM79_07660 [Pseudomonas agarici]